MEYRDSPEAKAKFQFWTAGVPEQCWTLADFAAPCKVTNLFPLALSVTSAQKAKHALIIGHLSKAVLKGYNKAWTASSKISATSSCPATSFPTRNSPHLQSDFLCCSFCQLCINYPHIQKSYFLQRTHDVDHGFWLIDPCILYAWMRAIIYE